MLAELSSLRGGQTKLAWLVAFGRALPPPSPDLRVPDHLVPGCLARLWLVRRFEDGRCYFEADSDSQIVRGIAGLLCTFYSGSEPREILGTAPAFLSEVGIAQYLTTNRRNSLARVWDSIRDFAQTHLGTAGTGAEDALST